MAESTIITGQFVRISQTPASIGERMLALIIDYFFLFIYVIGFSVTLSYLRIHAYSGFSFFFLFVIGTLLFVVVRSLQSRAKSGKTSAEYPGGES